MSEQNSPLTVAGLKTKVDNYREFATKEIAPHDVFFSAVFDRAAIEKIVNGADGVRVYMAKESPELTGKDVSYLMVPVIKTADGFEDQINDGHELMNSMAMLSAAAPCMGPFCK